MEDAKHPSLEKKILEVKDEWSWYTKFGAHILNASGTFLWIIVTYFILISFNGDPQLVALRDSMLNQVVPSTAYGILTLIAAMSLATYLFPYFSFKKISKEGSPEEKAACMHYWGMIAIAVALIISAGIK